MPNGLCVLGHSATSTRNRRPSQIIVAIHRVLAGKVYLSDAMAEKLLHRVVGEGKGGRRQFTRVETLSDRELEVFRLIGQGQKRRRKSLLQMHLSPKTVETYRDRIRTKLNLTIPDCS